MANPKHEQVRQRYDRCCGYCGVSEVDAGGELTVDHFQPLSAGGDESDENLVYACSRCNLFKADFWPNQRERQLGIRVLHPLKDNVPTHLRLNEQTCRVEPLTDTGRFHIGLLELNRPALVALRVRRKLIALLEAKEQLLKSEIAQLRSAHEAQERYIALLRRMLGFPPLRD